MSQTQARRRARELYAVRGVVHVATTVCAHRGQFEQGPDAHRWIVVEFGTGQIVEGPT
jgi:hypothetical protein